MRVRCPEILPVGMVPSVVRVQYSREEVEEQLLKRVLVPWAVRTFGKLHEFPGLLRDDCIVLLHSFVTLKAQGELWRPGKPITEWDMERCLDFASSVVLTVLFPNDPMPFARLDFKDAIEEWFPYLALARQRVKENRGDERDHAIHHLMTEMWQHCGPKRDVEQFRSVVSKAARETGVISQGGPRKDRIVAAILEHYRKGIKGRSELYRAENGSIRLSSNELRDFLCSSLAGKRVRRNGPQTPKQELQQRRDPIAIQAPEVLDVPTKDPGPLPIAEVADALDAVRAVLKLREKSLRAGTLAAKTLPHVISLLSGERSLSDVASALGASKSGVQEAVEDHRQAIRSALARKIA